MIRLQNMVPNVYVSESRDFQLLLRMYDCVLNGVKYKIDSMRTLTDTRSCDTSLLQLLQTKLGFFTTYKLTDDQLRYILRAFPYIVKNKGSLLAIRQTIITLFKANSITADIVVQYSQEGISLKGVPNHTLIVGSNSITDNFNLLYDVLRYIMPTGSNIFTYFFTDIDLASTTLDDQDDVTTLFVSKNLASRLRHSDSDYPTEEENHILGNIDTMELYGTRDITNE